MYTGLPPFMNKNKIILMQQIATKGVDFTKVKNASKEFKNLLKRFLNPNQNLRLGGGENGIDEIKAHPFFKNVDWKDLKRKQITPPFIPDTSSTKDTRNIDKVFLKEKPIDSPVISKLTVS